MTQKIIVKRRSVAERRTVTLEGVKLCKQVLRAANSQPTPAQDSTPQTALSKAA